MPLILDGTNGVSGVDGSAGTPSYQGTDTNTGIFYPAADTIAFAEGGTEVMRIDSSGNVGIGTTSLSGLPASTGSLIAAGVLGVGNALADHQTSRGILQYISNVTAIRSYGATAGTGAIAFNTGGGGGSADTERMRIDSSGNVGIGTNSPGVRLEVSGTIRSTSATIADAATITPTAGTTNQYTVTALAQAATIAAPSGTPIDGQKLTIRLKDNGVARALTWTTSSGAYRAIGVTLPTTTSAGKVTYVGCIYNSQDTFWDVIAVTTQA